MKRLKYGDSIHAWGNEDKPTRAKAVIEEEAPSIDDVISTIMCGLCEDFTVEQAASIMTAMSLMMMFRDDIMETWDKVSAEVLDD